MKTLVTNPTTDYINVSDFSTINQALSQTVAQACVTVAPSMASTTTTETTAETTTTLLPAQSSKSDARFFQNSSIGILLPIARAALLMMIYVLR